MARGAPRDMLQPCDILLDSRLCHDGLHGCEHLCIAGGTGASQVRCHVCGLAMTSPRNICALCIHLANFTGIPLCWLPRPPLCRTAPVDAGFPLWAHTPVRAAAIPNPGWSQAPAPAPAPARHHHAAAPGPPPLHAPAAPAPAQHLQHLLPHPTPPEGPLASSARCPATASAAAGWRWPGTRLWLEKSPARAPAARTCLLGAGRRARGWEAGGGPAGEDVWVRWWGGLNRARMRRAAEDMVKAPHRTCPHMHACKHTIHTHTYAHTTHAHVRTHTHMHT